MKYFIGFCITLLVLVSCKDSKKQERLLVDSSGRMNHILVVIKNSDWQGKVGDSIRTHLAKECLGLPQPEPVLHLNQIAPQNFTSFLKNNRNLLFVEFGKKDAFKITRDVYAEPQLAIKISALNKESFYKILNKNSSKIINLFKQADIKLWQRKNLRNPLDISNISVFKELNITMKIPQNYGLTKFSDKDHAWFVKNIPEGYQNILVYSVPINSVKTENGENIIADRDKRGYYLPGDNTHMVTEPGYTPNLFETTLNGLKTYETRGKWMMKENEMAGPFLNYSVVDKKNNRLIVVEGLTYAPNAKKRNYMFELEAILKTLKIK